MKHHWRTRLALIAGLGLIWLASSWALLRPGFFRVHDFVHAARVAELTRAASEGHWPVRWSANFGTGYGMPLFEFYAPLPFYVGGLLWWSGVPMIAVLKVLWAGSSLITMLGGYYLGKKWRDEPTGLLTAAAVTLAPYRAVNLFVRGALSEAWGIMALPWLLLGTIKVARGEKWGWLMIVLSLATLCLSHNLMTILCVPLSVMFGVGVLVIEKPAAWWQRLLKMGASYVLGLALTIFYLVPAYFEKDFTKVSQIVGGYFDYSLHFLYLRQFVKPGWGYGGSSWGPEDGLSFFLGWGQWLGVVLSIILAVRWWEVRSKSSWRKLLLNQDLLKYSLVMLLTGVSIFMTLGRSAPIWQAVQPLQFVQFPWRWLGPASVFLALAVGSVAGWLKTARQRWSYAIVVSLVIGLGNVGYFQPEAVLRDPSGLYSVDVEHIQSHLSQVLNDYVPTQMPGVLDITPPAEVVTVAGQPVRPDALAVNRGHEKLLKVSLAAPAEVVWSIADFPGWRVSIDGHWVAKHQASPGLVAVNVPAGEHLVGVQFGPTPIRQVSDTVSGLALLVVVGILVAQSQVASGPAVQKARQHD